MSIEVAIVSVLDSGRGGHGSRRWITLISVGWLPPDFTSSRSGLGLVAWVGRLMGRPLIAESRVLLTGLARPESNTLPISSLRRSGEGATVFGSPPQEFSTPCPRRRAPLMPAVRWARGGELRSIAQLSARVAWGLTPQAETVAGAAEMTVDLPTLSGSLNLTGLERWSANAAPGTAGSGHPHLCAVQRAPIRTAPLLRSEGGGLHLTPYSYDRGLGARYPLGLACVFRSKPITHSSPNRSLIPFQADHLFQSMPITDSSPMPITFWLATGTVGGV